MSEVTTKRPTKAEREAEARKHKMIVIGSSAAGAVALAGTGTGVYMYTHRQPKDEGVALVTMYLENTKAAARALQRAVKYIHRAEKRLAYKEKGKLFFLKKDSGPMENKAIAQIAIAKSHRAAATTAWRRMESERGRNDVIQAGAEFDTALVEFSAKAPELHHVAWLDDATTSDLHDKNGPEITDEEHIESGKVVAMETKEEKTLREGTPKPKPTAKKTAAKKSTAHPKEVS